MVEYEKSPRRHLESVFIFIHPTNDIISKKHDLMPS